MAWTTVKIRILSLLQLGKTGEVSLDLPAAGGVAPANAKYITQQPDATLSAEQALSALATGILKSTTATGVVSIATPGVDYALPGASGGLTLTDFTKDLGVAHRGGSFDITGLAGLTPDKNVLVVQTAQKITSKGDARDEAEMDQIQLTGYVLDAATVRCFWNSTGVVVGTYAFGYSVSA